MPEASTHGGYVQSGKLVLDYHKGVMYVPGVPKKEPAVNDKAATLAWMNANPDAARECLEKTLAKIQAKRDRKNRAALKKDLRKALA